MNDYYKFLGYTADYRARYERMTWVEAALMVQGCYRRGETETDPSRRY